MRGVRLIAAWAAVTTLALPGRGQTADPDTQTCISSYEHAQELRIANRLKTALDELRVCAHASCPDQLRSDCVKWSGEVETALPTVVFIARDRADRDVSRVQVTLDGAPDAQAIDGRAVTVDPGPHHASFVSPGGTAVEVDFVAQPGEHDRPVRAVIDVPAATRSEPPPEAAPRPAATPWVAITLGAVGVVALGAGAYVGIAAKSDVDRMRDDCAPRCNAGDIDDARRRLRVADALMATGVVALGVGTYLYFSSRSTDSGEHRSARASVGVKAINGGGFLSLARSF